MSGWQYHGANVQVPFTADIPTIYRANKSRRWAVQEVLDQTAPWEEGDDPIETREFPRNRFERLVVEASEDVVFWAYHRGHHAKRVELSPFVFVRRRPLTNLFTIELVGTPAVPRLVRAYPGDYTPPLPWQRSANWGEGGLTASLAFWRTHAYVFQTGLTTGSRSEEAPDWYRA